MTNQRYHGSCHCGLIQFSFVASEIQDGMQCNCSMCRRKGITMTNFTVAPEAITIESPDGVMSTYRFDTQVAKHHFCQQCGVTPFVETRLSPGQYRINIGCIAEVDVFELSTTMYDGISLS